MTDWSTELRGAGGQPLLCSLSLLPSTWLLVGQLSSRTLLRRELEPPPGTAEEEAGEDLPWLEGDKPRDLSLLVLMVAETC